VRDKLNKRLYKTPMEACEEVRLVWRNCATYNQPGTPTRRNGDLLADVWEKAWAESRIEDRWLDLQTLKDPAVRAVCIVWGSSVVHGMQSTYACAPQPPASLPCPNAHAQRAVPLRVNHLSSQLKSAVKRLGPGECAGAAAFVLPHSWPSVTVT
jgi:hypothetical protein